MVDTSDMARLVVRHVQPLPPRRLRAFPSAPSNLLPSRAMLSRLDRAVYRVERALVALMLTAMGLVVFLDVVYRVSTRTESLLANPWVMGTAFALLGALAVHTRGRPAWLGLPVGLAFVAGQKAFVTMLPYGLVWSQTLALSLTLWLGLMGASLAAYERRHLAMDIGSKLWPPSIAPKMAALGHALTAACCLFLLWLAARSLFGYDLGGAHVPGHWDVWSDSDGAAGTMMALPIPKWVVFASIPYGMVMLAFRFLLHAARTWAGEEPAEEDDALAQLGLRPEAE